jgi:basic membrane lipoprotein Med (substrate-binding protein (PBP1-ABC) superfamily)
MVCLGLSAPLWASGAKESSPAQAQKFRVALLIPSTVTDGGWSQLAYEGLQMMQKELGVETSHVQAGNPGDMIESASQYAEEGYNVIIGHGFQYSEPFSQISDKYPKTVFITTGGSIVKPNQSPIQMKLEQVCYIAGAVAAEVSKTKQIGFIGGMNIPAVSKTFRGFELGAKSRNPNIQVVTTYVGSLDNVNAGYEAAIALIEKGCDILYANANAVGLGVIKAANEKGVYIFGQGFDQSNLAPNYMIASMGNNTKQALFAVVKRIQEGNYEGGMQAVGLAEGVCELIWNPRVRDKLSAEIIAIPDLLKPKIISGEIHVPAENE